jgi:hypothetical protein
MTTQKTLEAIKSLAKEIRELNGHFRKREQADKEAATQRAAEKRKIDAEKLALEKKRQEKQARQREILADLMSD